MVGCRRRADDDRLDLSPLQLVLMGTAMEGAVFLFEIPTGVVADTYSRRLSLIVGYLGMGATWMLVGLVSAPWLIIALWGLWGLSYTFTSGAEEAWIADEVGRDKMGRVFLRGARLWYIGAVLGLVLQVAIGIGFLTGWPRQGKLGVGWATLADVRLNGASVPEAGVNAAIAGHFKVPVVMVTGDDAVAREIAGLLPGAETVTVKWAYDFHSARTVTPEAACELIRDAATRVA